MASRRFSFPNPVNEVAARLVATGVVALWSVELATAHRWLLIPLAYGFIARVLAGPTFSPLGRIVTDVVVPDCRSHPAPSRDRRSDSPRASAQPSALPRSSPGSPARSASPTCSSGCYSSRRCWNPCSASASAASCSRSSCAPASFPSASASSVPTSQPASPRRRVRLIQHEPTQKASARRRIDRNSSALPRLAIA